MKPTPPGTWPLLISGAQFLLVVPALFLGQVVPQPVAIVGALAFAGVAIAAVIWSYLIYQRERGGARRGIPIAGIVVGLIVAVLAATVVVPAAMA